MKCNKCFQQMDDDAKFCSSCGHKLDENETKIVSPTSTIESKTVETSRSDMQVNTIPQKVKKENSFWYIVKSKIRLFWSRLDLFSKIVTVLIVVSFALMLVGAIADKEMNIVISILQILGAGTTIMIHREIVKLNENKRLIKSLFLIMTVMLVLINFWSFSWDADEKYEDTTINTQSIVQEDALVPFSAVDCVGSNYTEIENAFRSAGFENITSVPIEDILIEGEDGLNAVESISVNGVDEFIQNQEFNIADEVIIKYHTYKKYEVIILVDFFENLLFNKYDVVLEVDGIKQGEMEHGVDGSFELLLAPGDHVITFVNAEISSISEEVVIKITENTNVEFEILTSRNFVDVDMVDGDSEKTEDINGNDKSEVLDDEMESNMVMAPYVTREDYKGVDHRIVEQAFRDAGFTNIDVRLTHMTAMQELDGLYKIGETASIKIDSESIENNSKDTEYDKSKRVEIEFYVEAFYDPLRDGTIEKILPPLDSVVEVNSPYEENYDFTGTNYLVAQQMFLESGFKSINMYHEVMTKEQEDNGSIIVGQIKEISINGAPISDEANYYANDEVDIIYYESYSKYKVPMTIDNNEDFKKLMSVETNSDPFVDEFVDEYENCIIEFSAVITRSYPMYNNELDLEIYFETSGPDMFCENVSSSEYNWTKDYIGQTVTVQAIVDYNNSYDGVIMIYPIFIK